MTYQIHIAVPDESGDPLPDGINLAAWKSAILATDGVHLISGGVAITNLATGEVSSLGGREGDAELEVGKDRVPVAWNGGSASFSATESFDDPEDGLRRKAIALAKRLGALVIGDEGDIYE